MLTKYCLFIGNPPQSSSQGLEKLVAAVGGNSLLTPLMLVRNLILIALFLVHFSSNCQFAYDECTVYTHLWVLPLFSPITVILNLLPFKNSPYTSVCKVSLSENALAKLS